MRTMMGLAIVAAVCVGCSSPTAPSAVRQSDLDYTINVPRSDLAKTLQAAYPDGVRMAPVTAQDRYNFTPEYHGTPNVYAGPTIAGGLRTYSNTGIVTAPYAVASRDVFPATAWPDEYGRPFGGDPSVEFSWVGRFVFTEYRDQ